MTLLSDKQQATLKTLRIIVFCVGIHSATLGSIIYFFTDDFYAFLLGEPITGTFFVRQAGIFLFLSGLFYLFPLIDIQNHHQLVLLTILSKVLAVIFLTTNAHLTPSPPMIFLTAASDGCMAIALAIPYFLCLKRDLLGKT
ncbi:MAG: hypothetical protein IH594_17070 [Bacteroidales bacterium]|nr:hypothetical protein [Bacteroidales bacterium]